MRRITALMMTCVLLAFCCACGQPDSKAESVSEWTIIDGGSDAGSTGARPFAEEEETENGRMVIQSMFLNTQFSTEYQHLIYIMFDVTNESEEAIMTPEADPESGTGSACVLWINGNRYDDLYPMNEWMQLPKGDDRFMSSGEGSDIPAGKTVRMIACFQIETENIGDDTTLKLEFHSENSRLSAEAVVADIQKASNIDQMIQSE